MISFFLLFSLVSPLLVSSSERPVVLPFAACGSGNHDLGNVDQTVTKFAFSTKSSAALKVGDFEVCLQNYVDHICDVAAPASTLKFSFGKKEASVVKEVDKRGCATFTACDLLTTNSDDTDGMKMILNYNGMTADDSKEVTAKYILKVVEVKASTSEEIPAGREGPTTVYSKVEAAKTCHFEGAEEFKTTYVHFSDNTYSCGPNTEDAALVLATAVQPKAATVSLQCGATCYASKTSAPTNVASAWKFATGSIISKQGAIDATNFIVGDLKVCVENYDPGCTSTGGKVNLIIGETVLEGPLDGLHCHTFKTCDLVNLQLDSTSAIKASVTVAGVTAAQLSRMTLKSVSGSPVDLDESGQDVVLNAINRPTTLLRKKFDSTQTCFVNGLLEFETVYIHLGEDNKLVCNSEPEGAAVAAVVASSYVTNTKVKVRCAQTCKDPCKPGDATVCTSTEPVDSIRVAESKLTPLKQWKNALIGAVKFCLPDILVDTTCAAHNVKPKATVVLGYGEEKVKGDLGADGCYTFSPCDLFDLKWGAIGKTASATITGTGITKDQLAAAVNNVAVSGEFSKVVIGSTLTAASAYPASYSATLEKNKGVTLGFKGVGALGKSYYFEEGKCSEKLTKAASSVVVVLSSPPPTLETEKLDYCFDEHTSEVFEADIAEKMKAAMQGWEFAPAGKVRVGALKICFPTYPEYPTCSEKDRKISLKGNDKEYPVDGQTGCSFINPCDLLDSKATSVDTLHFSMSLTSIVTSEYKKVIDSMTFSAEAKILSTPDTDFRVTLQPFTAVKQGYSYHWDFANGTAPVTEYYVSESGSCEAYEPKNGAAIRKNAVTALFVSEEVDLSKTPKLKFSYNEICESPSILEKTLSLDNSDHFKFDTLGDFKASALKVCYPKINDYNKCDAEPASVKVAVGFGGALTPAAPVDKKGCRVYHPCAIMEVATTTSLTDVTTRFEVDGVKNSELEAGSNSITSFSNLKDWPTEGVAATHPLTVMRDGYCNELTCKVEPKAVEGAAQAELRVSFYYVDEDAKCVAEKAKAKKTLIVVENAADEDFAADATLAFSYEEPEPLPESTTVEVTEESTTGKVKEESTTGEVIDKPDDPLPSGDSSGRSLSCGSAVLLVLTAFF